MNVRALYKEDRAVSPVIGVVLMVAVTVVLASVIGVFAVGLGETAQTNVPEVDFDFTYGSGSSVTISHEGGQNIDASDLEIRGAGGGTWPSRISSGDSWTGNVNAGADEIVVVWRDDDGRTSHVIARSPVPS